MPLYYYKAIDEEGIVHKGAMNSLHVDDLSERLHEQQLYLIKLTNKVFHFSSLRSRAKISDQGLEEFCLHVAALDRAGVTALEILESLRGMTEEKNFRAALSRVIATFKKGTSLADSFQSEPHFFDAVFCSMVASTGKMGTLAPVFDQLSQLFRWRHELKNHLWKSLRYPIVLTVMVAGLIVLLMTWVVPQMEAFLKSLQQELPTSTRALMFVSQHALFFFEIFSGCLGVGFLTIMGLRRLSYRGMIVFDRWLLSVPLVVEILKKMDLQRFLQILVSLVKREISLPDSLKMAIENIQNLFVRENMIRLQSEILKGVSFSQAWETLPLKERLIGRLARTGESSGQFSSSLGHGIIFLRRDIEYLSQRLVSILEPTLILFLGGVMIWIASSIFLPLYDQMMVLE